MKQLATCIVALGCLALAAPVMAGPPLAGTYQTIDLGGSVSLGRYTEAWGPGGGALLPGTVINALSWDGATLGAEWRYACAIQAGPAVLLVDNVDGNGDGNRTYQKAFAGGTIWLSGTGPWGNGDAAYPGVIDSYHEFVTIQYVGGVSVAEVSNIQARAHFDNYPTTCMAFSIANGSLVGTTDWGQTKPANYPAFLLPDCTPLAPEGQWWNLTTATLTITSGCTTDTRRSTWGRVKTLYR